MIRQARISRPFVCVVVAAVALPAVALAAPELAQLPGKELVLIEQGPVMTAVLYADGREVQVQTEREYRFMVGSDTANLTIDDLREIVLAAKAAEAAAPPIETGSRDALTGLDMILNVTDPPPRAQNALDQVEAYYEAVFLDPVTVTINISFAVLPANVLGWTSSSYTSYILWNDVRNGLIADMDANDVIQDYLPTSTIPVRYNASGTNVTNENTCRFTIANYNATLGSLPGVGATMQFNTIFAWDYDPPDIDPGTYCFQSVAAHEIGHVLGFTSRADVDGNTDINALDIFRFQQSNPAWNPSEYWQFTSTPRTVDSSYLLDDSVSDIITAEYDMTNGDGNQASHFRQQPAPGTYLMDPNLAARETFYPDFMRQADKNMFDAIGWDYPRVLPPTPAPSPHEVLKNRYIAFTPGTGATLAAFQVELTAGPGATGVLGWVGTPWDPSCQNEDGSPLTGSPPCLGEDYVARVVDTRIDRVWPEFVVEVTDCEIVPVGEYALRTILDGEDAGNFHNFSPPLIVQTIPKPDLYWGDTVGQSYGTFWTGPQGVVNVTDLQALLLAIQDLGGPHPSWVDVHGLGPGSPPNFILNVADVQQLKFALQGATFLGSNPEHMNPADCP